MRLLEKTKDGGNESTVDSYFLIEWKKGFSIALLKFNEGSRENFHSHAFNAWTWFITGDLVEECYKPPFNHFNVYKRSIFPKKTSKDNLHRVHSIDGPSWCITIRGPWSDYWTELEPATGKTITLTHGRKEV